MKTSFLLIGFVLVIACQYRTPLDESGLLKWINNPKNGLVSMKRIGSVELQMKYLPPQYLVTKELRGKPLQGIDVNALMEVYSQGMAFHLMVKPTGTDAVIFRNIRTLEDYKQRVNDLNFSFVNRISLVTRHGTVQPVLATMENTYDLQSSKSFYILFADTEHTNCLSEMEEIEIVFNDDVFETGITHFHFSKKRISSIPSVAINGIALP